MSDSQLEILQENFLDYLAEMILLENTRKGWKTLKRMLEWNSQMLLGDRCRFSIHLALRELTRCAYFYPELIFVSEALVLMRTNSSIL
jgi:hypothetical protein